VTDLGRFALALILLISTTSSPGAEPANRLLKGSDGKAFFPIGLYGFPQGRTDDAIYQEARDAGFNFLVGREAKHGFVRSFDLPSGPPDPDAKSRRCSLLDLTHNTEQKRQLLEQLIAQHEATTGLIIWQGPDEPNDFPFGIRPGPTPAGLQAGANVLRASSRHPLWINFGPTGDDLVPSDFSRLRPYLAVPDIVSTDIYPIGGGAELQQSPFAERGPASVGIFTRNLVSMVSHEGIQRKPVWMVLQAFGWGDLARRSKPPQAWTGRTPTYEEMRFMSFNAIINGAGGVIYWGLPYLSKDNDTLWPALKRVAAELNGLLPILTGDALPADHYVSSSDPAVESAVRRAGSTYYVLLANTRELAVETNLAFHGIKVSQLVPLGQDASNRPKAQEFSLKLNPWQTAVLKIQE
jgi:hypothetical protein